MDGSVDVDKLDDFLQDLLWEKTIRHALTGDVMDILRMKVSGDTGRVSLWSYICRDLMEKFTTIYQPQVVVLAVRCDGTN